MNVYLITALKILMCLVFLVLTAITIGEVPEAYVYAGF